MPEVIRVSIPCRHETDNIPKEQSVSDYHPLTKQQVFYLLSLAALNPHSPRFLSSIQVRLGQSIKGSQCPCEITGPISRRHTYLDRVFVAAIQDGTIESRDVYELICKIIFTWKG